MIKKITFLGNFEVPYSTESHHLITYRKLGYEVTTFQEGKATSTEILKSALESDLFVWTHTHGWNTPGSKELLQILKVNNIPSVGYHLDLWKGIKREADLQTDPYWDIEYFFTVDYDFIPDLEARGIKAFYLPAGVLEDECYLGTPREDFKYDVIFVGAYNYHPEWPYRRKLIDWLSETYGNRFARFAGDTKFGTIRGKDLNDLYASAKIVIGDTLCPGFNKRGYYSDRLFETIGRGGFLIMPYIKCLENLFNINNEIVVYKFNDFENLKKQIDYYLANEREREAIKLRGYIRVKEDHTYTNRLNHLIYMLDTPF